MPDITALRTALALSFALVAGIVAATVPATGHAVLIDSDPGDGAVVEQPPEVVVLEFSEPVQASFSQVAVLDEAGNHYESGEPDIVGGTVTQAVADIGPGEYQLSFRVTSADGHPVSDVLTFTIAKAAADDAATEAASDDGQDSLGDDGQDWVPLALGGAAIVLAATAGFVLIARRRTPPDSGDDPTAQNGRP